MRKFEAGEPVLTEAVYDRYWKDRAFRVFVNTSVGDHLNGDWGDVSEEDKKANDEAVTNGGRIFSSYKRVVQNQEERIDIVTEADRSTTTIMLAEEY